MTFNEIVNMIRVAEENSTQVMDIISGLRKPIEDIPRCRSRAENMHETVNEFKI